MIRIHGYKKIQYEEGDNIDGMFNTLDLIDCNVDVAKRRLFLLKQSLNDYWFNTEYTGNTDFDVEASMFGKWYWKKIDNMLKESQGKIVGETLADITTKMLEITTN